MRTNAAAVDFTDIEDSDEPTGAFFAMVGALQIAMIELQPNAMTGGGQQGDGRRKKGFFARLFS